MNIKKGYDKNYGKWFAGDVLRAVNTYSLIHDGESICVALSGGKDSITLLYILWYLNIYSHMQFNLSALHIKTDRYDTSVLKDLCEEFNISYFEESLCLEQAAPDKSICYVCSRLKRGAISDILKEQGISKIAYGHHANDVAETFFMNMVVNRKLGSFSPRVQYIDNDMVIIRPMIYLDEQTIINIHKHAELPILSYQCPYEQTNIRKDFKKAVEKLDVIFDARDFSKRLVSALENIDETNIWEMLKTGGMPADKGWS
jgi:tRNA 2-thiocytidine biosynthesis protein TtcA